MMWTLLHGFTGAPQSWNDVIDHAGLDAPFMPYLLGHGQQWKATQVDSFRAEVARLRALVASFSPPRRVCGYSMGARVAIGLLASDPSLFDTAVLVGAQPGLRSEEARAERLAVDTARIRDLRHQPLCKFIGSWERMSLFASQRQLSEHALAKQRKIRLEHDPEGLARSLQVLGLAKMPNYEQALRRIPIPVTLLTGSLDTKFTQMAKTLVDASAQIKAQVIPGVGHNVVLEAPAAVAAVLHRAEQRTAR